MRPLAVREKILAIIVVAAVACFLLVNGIYRPLSNYYQSMEARYSDLEQKLLAKRQILRFSSSVQKSYSDMEASFRQQASGQEEKSSIMTAVDHAADLVGLGVAHVEPREDSGEGGEKGVKVHILDLTVDGSWDELVNFLYVLEGPPYFFAVDGLKLEHFSGKEKAVRGQLTLKAIRLVN